MNIVAIIPARIGSKRIPKKNLEKVGDKTLVEHALHAAVKCLHINRIILYVDSLELVPEYLPQSYDTMEDFADIPLPNKRVYIIEDKLASDEMKLDDNLRTMVDYLLSYDYVVLLQPTSPLRTTDDIIDSLAHIVDKGSDSLFTVCTEKWFTWSRWKCGKGRVLRLGTRPTQGEVDEYIISTYDLEDRPNSQVSIEQYIENGAIYIFKPAVLRDENARIGGGVSMHSMPKSRSFEIDEPEDLELVRAIYEYQHRK